jgi:hypothetical protein
MKKTMTLMRKMQERRRMTMKSTKKTNPKKRNLEENVERWMKQMEMEHLIMGKVRGSKPKPKRRQQPPTASRGGECN